MEKKNILIFGGEFFNKGAQSMSFITISRLMDEFPDHEIIFVSEWDNRRNDNELVNYNFMIAPDPFRRNTIPGENLIRKIVDIPNRKSAKVVKQKLENTEYLFDISGYALSSQFGARYSKYYLKKFDKAHKMGIKTIILPQSIGPFEFGKDQQIMEKRIADTLSKVSIIMPREKQGEELLNNLGLVENVHRNADLVLTSRKEIDWENIYKKPLETKEYRVEPNSVIIVPNAMNTQHGDKGDVIDLYTKTINELLAKGKNIYLVRHSSQDSELIKLIKQHFQNNEKVFAINDDMTPEEFEKLVKQVEFTISSRFHAIVHSYKAGIPSVIIGWAVKYIELAKLFNQEKYVFDVRNNLSMVEYMDRLSEMGEKFEMEAKIIREKLDTIDELSDPFDYVFKVIK